MTYRKISPIPLNPRMKPLLSNGDLNLLKSALGRLPEIDNKFKVISAAASPTALEPRRTCFKTFFSSELVKKDIRFQGNDRHFSLPNRNPQLVIAGTTKKYDKHYFPKVYIDRIVIPKIQTKKKKKKPPIEEYYIDGWKGYEEDKA